MDGLCPMACGQLDSTGGSFKHPRLGGGGLTDDWDRVGKFVLKKTMFFFWGVLKVDTHCGKVWKKTMFFFGC